MKPGIITLLTMQVCCKHSIGKHFLNEQGLLWEYWGNDDDEWAGDKCDYNEHTDDDAIKKVFMTMSP